MNKGNKILIAIVSSASMMISSNVFAAGLCVWGGGSSKKLNNIGDTFTCDLGGRSLSPEDHSGSVSFGLSSIKLLNPQSYMSTKYECTLDFKEWDPNINPGEELFYSYTLAKYNHDEQPPLKIISKKEKQIPTPTSVPIPTMKTKITFNSGPDGDCHGDGNCFFLPVVSGGGQLSGQVTIHEKTQTGSDVASPLTVTCTLLEKTPLFQKMNPDFPPSS